MKHRILILLMLPVLLIALSGHVFATDETDILEQTGSLTFQMNFGGTPLNNGMLSIYRVGNIEQNADDEFCFVPVEELAGYNFDFSDLSDQQLAENLLTASKQDASVLYTARIQSGKVVFENLKTGLYLVWQSKENVTDGYQPIQPFLISVPYQDGENLLLDVISVPKVPLVPTPPPPENPPPPPNLPQTGQLKWPVPVMAAVGSLLFITGFALCVGRKKNSDEA